MQKGDYLNSIIRADQTVFSTSDISLLWHETNLDLIKSRLNSYIKTKKLFHIRQGLYAKSKEFDRFELATRIYTPSYISFETVLAKEGLIFQKHNQITIASYLSRDITIQNQNYSFTKVKDSILLNQQGIENKQNLSIATRERAFLDTLYSHTDYHFDNLRSINWDIVDEILPLYQNKRMNKIVSTLSKQNDH